MTDLERHVSGQTHHLLLTVREQLAPGATMDEVKHFVLVCRHLGLDPFVGHINLIGRKRKFKVKNGRGQDVDQYRVVYKPEIAVAGRRAIAARTGRLQGIEGPVWCGPRDNGGDLVWREVWDDNETPPYAARVLVWPQGWVVPANGTAKWSEMAQEGSNTWQRMPSHMLGKVAESLALRRAFPEVEEAVGYIDPRPDADPDDAAILAEIEAEAEAEEANPPGPGTGPTAPGPTGPGSPSAPARTARGVAAYPPRAGADRDRVPDDVYDSLPEAQGIGVIHSYRYDPDDAKQSKQPKQ